MAKKAGTLAVSLTANSTQFDRTLARTEQRIRAFSGAAKSAFAAVGIGLGASALIGAGKQMIDTFDNIGKRSDLLKVSTDRYQELSYAASRTGTAIGTVESAIMRLTKAQAAALTGDAKMAGAFRLAGLTLDDIRGLKPDQLFDAVANSLAMTGDEAHRNQIAFELFGKSAGELNNFLAGYVQLGQEARDLGLIVDEKSIRAAEKINDQLEIMNRQIVKLIESLSVFEKMAKLIEGANSTTWGDIWDAITDPFGVKTKAYEKATGKSVGGFWGTADFERGATTAEEVARLRAAEARRKAEREANAARENRMRATAASELAGRVAGKKPEVSYEKIASWLGDLARAPEETAAKIRDIAATRDTAGAFSLRDLAMTVTQNSPAERTADATEEIASNSKKQTEVQLGLASTVGAAMGMLSEVQTYQ